MIGLRRNGIACAVTAFILCGTAAAQDSLIEGAKEWARSTGLRAPAEAALRIAFEEGREALGSLPREEAVRILCQAAMRAESGLRFGDSLAAQRLAVRRGYRLSALKGGAESVLRLEAGLSRRSTGLGADHGGQGSGATGGQGPGRSSGPSGSGGPGR
jgi:hypothetical protein